MLPTDVAKKYELVDWKGGSRQVFGRFGVVDLNTLTVKQAEKLVRMGFPKLRKVTKKKDASSKESVSE